MNNPTQRPKGNNRISTRGQGKDGKLGMTSNHSSWASNMSSANHDEDHEPTGFLIQTKQENGRKKEFRFYII